MLKKFFVSAALAVTVVGGMGLGAGTAFAGSDLSVFGGVYPSERVCQDAAYAGHLQGRWIAWECKKDVSGQYLLWVEPY